MSPRNTTTSSKSGKPAVKTTAGKTAATKTGVARPATAKPRPKVKKSGLVSPVDRLRFIAETAYYKAEKRGFAEGDALGDWIEAEAEIDALLDSRGAG
ncbi:MAG: DUF2934 domain-containing protein [Rhodocyclales bacterium]|nr:DUF2934 domain-containing protein [Rhodocyclales bacterium]